MDVTDRDLAFLRLVAEHYCVTAEHLRAGASPGNSDTTVVRRRLRLLHAAGLIGIARAEALTLNNGVHAQVYYPTQPGMLELARRTGEMRWVLTPTRPPFPLPHASWNPPRPTTSPSAVPPLASGSSRVGWARRSRS